MRTKICTKCKIEKKLDNFRKDKKGKYGHTSSCKECRKKNDADYRKILNKEKNKENQKKYREKNKEILKIKNQIYKNKHKEESIKYSKIYRKNNKEKIKARAPQRNKYENLRKENDILYRIKCQCRYFTKNAFRNNGFKKSSPSEKILGCTFEEFKNHIENKFELWMNWDNHGNWNNVPIEFNTAWDYDHIIPISSAKTMEEVLELSHYTNIQPLCSKINREIKRNKIDYNNCFPL